jgi:hypothetical protein
VNAVIVSSLSASVRASGVAIAIPAIALGGLALWWARHRFSGVDTQVGG